MFEEESGQAWSVLMDLVFQGYASLFVYFILFHFVKFKDRAALCFGSMASFFFHWNKGKLLLSFRLNTDVNKNPLQ